MDWLKDITVEEVEELLHYSWVSEKDSYARCWNCLFKKMYDENYGTYFSYKVSTQTKNNPFSRVPDTTTTTRFIGQFGLLYNTDSGLADFNRILDGPLDDRSSSVHFNIMPDEGRKFFAFVAQKNKGVVDENGNTYGEAFKKAMQDYMQNSLDDYRKQLQKKLDKEVKERQDWMRRYAGVTLRQLKDIILNEKESGQNHQM